VTDKPYYPDDSAQKRLYYKFATRGSNSGGSEEDFSPAKDAELLQLLVKFIDSGLKVHQVDLKHLLPGPLRLVANFRDAKLRHEKIALELDKEPLHPWVKTFCQGWLEVFEDHTEIVGTGKIFDEEYLQETFGGEGESSVVASNLRRLAATVFCLGLHKADGWSSVYESLPHLITSVLARNPGATKQIESKREKAIPKTADSKTQRRRIKEFSDNAKSAQQEASRLQETLTAIKKDKDESDRNADQLKREYKKLEQKTESLENRRRKDAEVIKAEKATVTRVSLKNGKLEALVADSQKELDSLKTVHAEDFADLLIAQSRASDLNKQIEEQPEGLRGITTLLNLLIQEAKLKRDSAKTGSKKKTRTFYTKLLSVRRTLLLNFPEFEPAKRPRTAKDPKGSLDFVSIGGGSEIGASCYWIKLGSTALLIDAGIKVNAPIGSVGPDLSKLEGLPDFHAVVATHAHVDHSGWLPVIARRWPSKDIYLTPPTMDLLKIMLEDSFNNHRRRLAQAQAQANYTGDSVPELPYVDEDIESAIRSMKPTPFFQKVPISPDLSITLLPAGHILGAASVLIEGNGRRVLVTGDYSTFDQSTVPGCRWPSSEQGPMDLVVSESTYGHVRPMPRQDSIDDFIRDLNDTIEHGGVALIPVFAVGRSQEVLNIIHRAMEAGSLPIFDVWIDGLIEKINFVYQKNRRLQLGDTFHQVKGEGYTITEVVNKAKASPCAIVSTSGMMVGGPIMEYAKHFLPDGRTRVFLCGYQDEGSMGKQLLKRLDRSSSTSIMLLNEDGKSERVPVKANAKNYALSAHSDLPEMVAAIKALTPERVILVHGESNSQTEMAGALRAEGLSVEEGTELHLGAT